MTRRPLTAALLTILLLLPAAAAGAAETRLTFLHFNDVYDFLPNADSGGMAALHGLVERERAAHPGAVLTFGGDLLSPSLASGLTKGAHMVELLGAMAPLAAVPGNHEFDFGAQVLRQRMAESRFPWLVGNISEKDGAAFAGAPRLLLRDVNGVKVGLFSLLTAETAELAAGGREVVFLPVLDSARQAVAELRRQGARVVVALTHQDFQDDLSLARQVKGIDLILGGHDHEAMTFQAGPTLIVKAGHDSRYLAAVDLSVDSDGGKSTVRPLGWRLTASRGQPESPAVATLARRHAQAVDAALDRPVAVLDTPLDSRQEVVRGGEAALGNLVADAARTAMAADVALVNGGGLRGNRVYPAGTTLSRVDLLREMPFANTVTLLEISGADLRAALEHGVSKLPALAGRFPQVSGLTFSFDARAEPGQRVGAVTVGGQPLDPARRYRLATVNYLAEGGDGYAMLGKATTLVGGEAAPLLVNVVAEQAERLGRLTAKTEGRISPAP